MAYKYLSHEHITGFDKYKYNSLDTSPVSKYISHPFWDFVVQFYPRWIAPNVLTLAGFLLVVLNYISLAYYDYTFTASADEADTPPIPRWLWLTISVFVFLAHTLDGTDGKQARRTNMCGPLGELFDHGLDSWAVSFMVAAFASVCGCGEFGLSPFRIFCLFLAMITTFYLTHWEKYISHIMYLPWGYDIAQYTTAIVYMFIYVFGYTALRFHVPLLGWTFSEVYEAYVYAMIFGFSLPMTMWNIYVSYEDGSARSDGLSEALRPLAPLSLLIVLSFVWVANSSVDILSELRLLMFVIAILFSNIACRLIVSCMSNTRCDAFNWLLLPLVAMATAVSCVTLGRFEVYFLWAYGAVALVAHLHYGVFVVCQLAEHLGIRVFLVGKRSVKKTTRNSHKLHNNSH